MLVNVFDSILKIIRLLIKHPNISSQKVTDDFNQNMSMDMIRRHLDSQQPLHLYLFNYNMWH